MPTASKPDWAVTSGEMARTIGCSVNTVKRLLDEGQIPHWKVGRTRYANRADVEAYCAASGVRRGYGGVLVCSGGRLAEALSGALAGVRHAGCLGQAGQLFAGGGAEPPDWVVLDLGHCDRSEALAWAAHLKASSKARVMLLLPEGEQLVALPVADAVLSADAARDPAVILKEIAR